MAKRGRPAQGNNSNKRVGKMRAGGALVRTTTNNSNNRKRLGPGGGMPKAAV